VERATYPYLVSNLLETPCLQSGGVDLAKPRPGALSVGEPRCTALSSGDTAVLCCCTEAVPSQLSPQMYSWRRPAGGDPSAAWNMSFPSSRLPFLITALFGRFTRHYEHLT
jgi:hypothetical protein